VPPSAPNAPNVPTTGPLLIFDGDCSFCTSSAQWIEHRLPDGVRVEPWQRLELDAFHLTEHDVTTAAYWVDDRGTTYRGHRSIAKALIAAGGPWKVVGALLLVPPISWLAALGYVVVAKNRHRLPGGTPACKLPQ
jgi:predicted DCC family thiol-disulfide oxidoreductase YuxK